MFFDFLQIAGGLILSVGYFPQLKQIVKTKSVKDLNLKSFSMVLLGVFLMEMYAINLAVQGVGAAFLFTNTLSLLLAFALVALILKYREK